MYKKYEVEIIDKMDSGLMSVNKEMDLLSVKSCLAGGLCLEQRDEFRYSV